MRVCSSCTLSKPLKEFTKNAGKPQGRAYLCTGCRRKSDRAGYKAMPNSRKHLVFTLRRYGLTPEQYQAILVKQGNVCAICHNAQLGRMLVIDHDHECCPVQGKSCGKCIRGLLCDRCNVGLGMFRDSPTSLASAILYLTNWRT